MKTTTKIILTVFLLAFSLVAFAQQEKKEKISKAIENYFFMERENIHVHFDKNVFLSNEKIWFKGYVYHKKLGIPFYSCVNIFANLIDSDGNILESKLLCGNLGNFSGSFKLNSDYKSGKYYVQLYTNWMNNFTEDESSVYDVTIINPSTGIPRSLSKNAEAEVTIELKPESGVFLNDCHNTIGVHITGCDNTPLNVKEASVVNEKGEIIKKIVLNDLGYGKFDIVASNKNNLKVVASINGTNHEQVLPPLQAEGITMEANSYTMADKTFIKLRTNSFTYKKIENKPLYLTVQKDDKTYIMELVFNDNKLELTTQLENKELFTGVNTVRLIDDNLNQIAERLLYIYPDSVVSSQLNKISDDNGTVEFKGKVNNPYMNLSISVLPADTKSITAKEDIYGDLLLSPYIEGHPKTIAREYLNDISRSNKFEMDLYLISKKSKYLWNNILNNPPKENYTFDIGLAVKGTVNQKLKGKGYRLKISSYTGMLDERVALNEKNEFYLKHLVVPDSCKLRFTLLKRGEQPKDISLNPEILNNNRKFNKPFTPSKISCIDYSGDNTDLADFELPKYITKTVMLEEVKIEGKSNKLKYGTVAGNGLLRGYKITEGDTKSYFYILDMIRYHGFDVSNKNGEVSITGRTVTTINGQKTKPRVYLDNMYLMSFDVLDMVYTEDVDEFYINPHAPVPGVDNEMGIIKIYLKKDFSYRNKPTADLSFLLKDGFDKVEPFRNSDYTSTYDDKGFENFGIIDWHPNIMTDESGEFRFSIPKLYFGQVKVLIEGFGANGKVISEVKTINL
ncbi:hypothetical protein [Flavobacterium beibuense]|uniref:hypothetical protein n=1 Tax=Flavobacterium beibuense TaxID=657326 RepID=UPI00101C1EF6|nr:hypothetical protein [Flavobacterium beibuense]